MSENNLAPVGPLELLNRLRVAVSNVASSQAELWTYPAGERAIVGQIFFELRAMMWPVNVSVDTEWAREGSVGHLKGRSENPTVVPDPTGKGSARPDVIVHIRGESGAASNLMIVEFKLHALSTSGVDSDVKKIRALMSRHGYQTGAVVSLGTGSNPKRIDCVWLEAPNGVRRVAVLFSHAPATS